MDCVFFPLTKPEQLKTDYIVKFNKWQNSCTNKEALIEERASHVIEAYVYATKAKKQKAAAEQDGLWHLQLAPALQD